MKRVLDVGNCSPDHAAICDLIEQHFTATVEPAHSLSAAIEKLAQQSYDLVLVNRILDRDGSSGLEVIRQLKSQPTTRNVPVMLITNYENYQQQAMDLGAVAGFGKSTLHAGATSEKLRPYLS